MKKVAYLIIVNTNTPGGEEITKGDVIIQHTNPINEGGLGLSRPKIDDLILLDGSLENIIAETTPTEVDLWGIAQEPNGLLGQARYLGFVGGKTKNGEKDWDTRTKEQKESLETFVHFQVLKNPNVLILGLDQVPSLKGEEMPSFNVSKWLESIGIDEKNIFKGA
jgi:N-acetylmuramoyl-L-alanine amidase